MMCAISQHTAPVSASHLWKLRLAQISYISPTILPQDKAQKIPIIPSGTIKKNSATRHLKYGLEFLFAYILRYSTCVALPLSCSTKWKIAGIRYSLPTTYPKAKTISHLPIISNMVFSLTFSFLIVLALLFSPML